MDPQITSMAGEFLTVGKLFKRGYQASVTLGNAKAIDIFIFNPKSKKMFSVQVKTQRRKNCFPMKKESIDREHIYIFVRLNNYEDSEEFFIVPGKEILKDVNRFFGSSYLDPNKPSKMPAINYGPLNSYRDNWAVFDN
jgi:hypothetical protein